MMFVSFNSKMMGTTRGAEIAPPHGSPELTPVIFTRTFVAHSLVFCVVLCQPLFIFFLLFWPLHCLSFLAIVLFVLVFMTSDYPFVIFTFLIMY
jgi:hypothetical protein